MRDPVLATINHGSGKLRTTVLGGLHRIGTQTPYFSITADTYEYLRNGRSRCFACGCRHELIEELFPGRFTDLIALHLSDQNGVPMHAATSAYYWLAGAAGPLGGGAIDNGHLGEKYHGASGSSAKSAQECRAILASHLRIDEYSALLLTDRIRRAHYGHVGRWHYTQSKERAKRLLADFVELQRPRWKAEADACIAKHNLVVYGR